LVALLSAGSALARVGGGQSFSGGSHSSFGGGSSGGNGSGGDLVFLLFELIIDYPAVGLPVTAVVVVFFVVSRLRAGSSTGWSASSNFGDDTDSNEALVNASSVPLAGTRQDLLRIQESDPQFSLVLFEDFLYALYGEVQMARAAGKLASLSPYLAQDVITGIARDQGKPDKIEGVIVAGLHFLEVSGLEEASPTLTVRVRFETNYTEVSAGTSRTFYAVEIWTLIRSRTAHSRPPNKTRVFKCPNCGAPLEAVVAGKCSYCGKEVATGDLDWLVQAVDVLEREAREPVLFSDGTAPRDTLPTRTTSGAAERFDALQTRDPSFTFDGFRARVEMMFTELQSAWSNRDWSRARPFTSDRLFQEWAHWMELYRQEHARNVIERPVLNRLELCDVETDAFYDSITARLHAACIDYTVSDDGKLLGGSRSADKPFSEYWTLIRGAGAKGAPSAQKLCPQCGAELKINMAGRCEYCQAEVTSGQFDWVLSRIEQDEAYDG
jgi:predicted lipid-binding transport protein (Tim44 family)